MSDPGRPESFPRGILGAISPYLTAVTLVGVVFWLRLPIEKWAGAGASPVLYLPAVTLAAWYGGLGPGFLAMTLGGFLWVYFDIEPHGSFYIPSGTDRFRVIVVTIESLLICILMEFLHASRRKADRNAQEAEQFRASASRNESRLRAILQNSLTPIWMKDDEGRYLLVKQPYEALIRRRRDEPTGSTDSVPFLPAVTGPLSVSERAILDRGEAIEIEESLDLDDGTHTFLSVKFPMRDETGTIFAIGGISTDITDLKLAQRRAVQAERLAAIGQMVTGLAHESRNAIQRSQACLEMLRFRSEDRPDSLDLIAGIQDAQDDLQRLYEEVRTYAATLVLVRREGSIRSMIWEAWSQVEWSLKGRQTRLIERGVGDDCCRVDVRRMVQVFRNLLDNSVEACHDPVEVTIEWSSVTIKGRPGFQLILSDNGPGFSMEQRRNLFEPFYTTKTQGTGLGMAIARRIVEAHGGSITARDLDDDPSSAVGAAIVILLPRDET